MEPEPLPSWYVERPEGWTAQPTLHQYAEKKNLTFAGIEGKQIVWVKNEGDEEFAMCCYYKSGFCEFSIVKPEKRGKLGLTITRHVHASASCSVCGLVSTLTTTCLRHERAKRYCQTSLPRPRPPRQWPLCWRRIPETPQSRVSSVPCRLSTK